MIFLNIEESKTVSFYILVHDCHVRSTMIWEGCAGKASALADLGFLRARIVKNSLMLIYKHRAFGLRDHEQAWNVDTSKSKKKEGKLLPWRPSVASSWAQRFKVSYPNTKIELFVTNLSFSEHRSTRTYFFMSSLPRNQALPGVGRCSWWLHLHIPWAQTGSVDAKWCETNPVHIWIELRLKSTQPVEFCSRDGHLKTVRTMSEKRVMRVFVIRWVASI
jgi:hypothetical protein